MARFLARVVLGATVALTASALALTLTLALTSEAPAPEDLVFVTDGAGAWNPGCNAISVVDVSSGKALAHSKYRQDAGRLGVSSDGALVMAVSNFNERHVAGLRRVSHDPPAWTAFMTSYSVPHGSPISIAPDDSALFLVRPGSVVEKHLVSEMVGNALGPSRGRYTGAQAAEIVFSQDSSTAYVIGMRGYVHIVDVRSMSAAAEPIPYRPVFGSDAWQMRNTFASLSPDGRYLAINTGANQINVVDLVAHDNTLLDTPGLAKAFDLEFNYVHTDPTYLAVSSHGSVAVYAFDGRNSLQFMDSVNVPRQRLDLDPALRDRLGSTRFGTLAWTGRGDGIVVAIGGQREFRVLDFQPDGEQALRRRLDFDACQSLLARYSGAGFDVRSLNGRLPTPTPTLPPSPTATKTPPPTATVTTPTLTLTPSPRPTLAATVTPTDEATETTTAVPSPVFLPLALNERCTPAKQRADVALVIDASSSMEQLTSAGRTKIAAATEAAGVFLDQLQINAGDQAAIVAFNADAWLVQGLANDRDALDSALDSIRTDMQTCLVCGVDVAADELAGERRDPHNTPVMIVLTDGLSNPRPASEAVTRAEEAQDEGVVIYTIGIGDTLDFDALAQIASKPEYFYQAPDAEDLAGIYRQIAVEIPCPGKEFWGGR